MASLCFLTVSHLLKRRACSLPHIKRWQTSAPGSGVNYVSLRFISWVSFSCVNLHSNECISDFEFDLLDIILLLSYLKFCLIVTFLPHRQQII